MDPKNVFTTFSRVQWRIEGVKQIIMFAKYLSLLYLLYFKMQWKHRKHSNPMQCLEFVHVMFGLRKLLWEILSPDKYHGNKELALFTYSHNKNYKKSYVLCFFLVCLPGLGGN